MSSSRRRLAPAFDNRLPGAESRRHERGARTRVRAACARRAEAALLKQGFSQALLLRAGLLVQRDDGAVIDRFRNRLMIPICRDTGSVIAFGGRAVDADQQPEVPELARNTDLLEGPDALRPEPEQGGRSARGDGGASRGLFRLCPGVSGRVPGRRGFVRYGPDTRSRPSNCAGSRGRSCSASTLTLPVRARRQNPVKC